MVCFRHEKEDSNFQNMSSILWLRNVKENETDMGTHRDTNQIPRRRFLKGTGIVIVGALLAPSATHGKPVSAANPSSPEHLQSFVGTIEEITSDFGLTVNVDGTDADQAGSTNLLLGEDAFVSRGHQGVVDNLSEFVAGGAIFATGRVEGSIFRAETVMSAYSFIQGHLEGATDADEEVELINQNADGESTSTVLQFAPTVSFALEDGSRTSSFAEFLEQDALSHHDVVANLWREPVTGEMLIVHMGVENFAPAQNNRVYLPVIGN